MNHGAIETFTASTRTKPYNRHGRNNSLHNRLTGLILLFGVAAAGIVRAADSRYSGDGYVFFSVDRPGHASIADLLTVGGGGEALLYKGLGVNVDLGYQFPRESISDGIGLASLNGCYHFVNRAKPAKLVPFVTAGYAIAFRSGHANLFDYGGGVNYWFSRHVGLRGEIRDYRARYGDWAVAFRFGVAFR
jgi:hypothetical protein